ncbi:hypothetical protein CFS9_14740 [Flavobacterium sp. CFS9]|uniref:Uncharacterized protein n=1 Tax=Flavobacterium sp. CFS9 TaxID=3143118 RepID=A0AAT9H034_9FLAO|nr:MULTISPECIES: hypothetical protein [unclassified Flavobacterium]
MSKKEKDKDKKKDKKKKKNKAAILENIKRLENCKSSCCEKYKKSEKKRCSRCPMFDLFKKTA